MMLRFGQKEGAAKKRGEGTDDDLEFDDAVMEADDNMGDVIIIGAVEDENGHPLKGAEVYYYVNGEETDAEGGPYVAETNEDGEYQISVPFGSYVEITTVSKYGYKDADAPAELPDAIIANDIDLEFGVVIMKIEDGMQDVVITGVVKDEFGFPLKDAEVFYKVNGEETDGTGDLYVVETNEDGEYTITVPFGSYVEITKVTKFRYDDVNNADELPDPILANEYDPELKDVIMKIEDGMEDVVITGIVTDEQGHPIKGAEVYYEVNMWNRNSTGDPYITETDENGEYSITVPFGSYVQITKVSKSGYKDVDTQDELPDPVRAEEDDLEFDETVMELEYGMEDVLITVTGLVKDKNGFPVKGAEIYYTVNGDDIGEDGGICVVVTDENGVYTITAPFGSYVEITMVSKYGYKDVDTPDDLPDAILANEDGQKFNDIVVELQDGMENVSVIITGTVKDKEGLPVEGAEVYYKVNGEENAAGVRYVATTDEDGIYSITVPFGSYVEMTKVSKEGYRDVTGANYLPAPVRADDEDGIDLGDIIISKESAPSEGWFTESVKALLIVLILLTVSFLIPTVGLYIHMRGKKEE